MLFFQLMDEMLRRMNKIQQYYMDNKGATDESVARKCLADLRMILLDEQFSDPEEAMIQRIIVFLPCYEAYSKSYAPTMRVLPSSGHGPTLQNDTEANQYMVWNCFLCFLEGDLVDDLESPFCIHIAKTVFGADSPTESYLEMMKRCLVELRRLQDRLADSLFHNDTESTQLLIDVLPGPRIFQGRASLLGPSDDEKGKYTQIYEILSFSELVRSELLLLEQIDRAVHRCQICGKYFVPYRNTANACQRKNPAYGGERCTVVFTNMEYRKKHPELDTAMGKLYMAQYKAYSKWANESTAFVLSNAKLVYDKKELGSAKSELTSEIAGRQDAWREKAKEALLQFCAGTISEEQCKSLITLPRIIDRSPEFAEFRKEVSLSLGALREEEGS